MAIQITDILSGARSLEKAFSDKIPGVGPQPGPDINWYKAVITALKNKKPGFWKREKAAHEFSLAWAFRQAGALSDDNSEERNLYFQEAWQHFKEVPSLRRYPEISFFAAFNNALFLEVFSDKWPEIEEAHLIAYEIAPDRGEPLLQIIEHYLREQDWPVAYIFTSFCTESYFQRPPDRANWGLDRDLYNWKVLDLHTAVCFSMGKEDEAIQTFMKLMAQVDHHPELFTEELIDQFQKKREMIMGIPA